MFKKACFRSLNWPQNRAALGECEWHVFTAKEHFDEVVELFKERGFKLVLHQLGDSVRVAGCGMVPLRQCDAGVILLDGLRNQIAYSIQNKARMILAPPDTIFGDGSIANLLAIGNGNGRCVAVAHPRVLPAILEEIDVLGATRGAITNAQLVTMAEKHAHVSWKCAEIGHPKNNSYVGGIAWRRLEDGLVSVTHRLPTCYLADFNSSDFDFFWSQVSWGGWDHRWPAENLIRQERQRYVGSSDACFIVEITDWDKNVPPDPQEEIRKHVDASGQMDLYWNSHYHNGIDRQTCVIFRGE